MRRSACQNSGVPTCLQSLSRCFLVEDITFPAGSFCVRDWHFSRCCLTFVFSPGCFSYFSFFLSFLFCRISSFASSAMLLQRKRVLHLNFSFMFCFPIFKQTYSLARWLARWLISIELPIPIVLRHSPAFVKLSSYSLALFGYQNPQQSYLQLFGVGVLHKKDNMTSQQNELEQRAFVPVHFGIWIHVP